jgi:nucleoside-diphosphate-sugar epimerase
LFEEMIRRNYSVQGLIRKPSNVLDTSTDKKNYVVIGDFAKRIDWRDVLAGSDCVIHCAARAHVMNETEDDALAAYRSVNVDGTLRLAESAVASGVRRFVYVSSIKVNGERTSFNEPFKVTSVPKPEDPYGISKWEAEQSLLNIADKTGLEVVIVRPPLVYGPKVKGNLIRLLGLLQRRLPLPLGLVKNKRSMIGLDNLVDLLIQCTNHPNASGQTFLASDGEDLSTPALLLNLSSLMGKPARMLPIPVQMLRLIGNVLGKQNEIERLTGSLVVDSSYTRDTLGWVPPISVNMGLKKMVDWYIQQQ